MVVPQIQGSSLRGVTIYNNLIFILFPAIKSGARRKRRAAAHIGRCCNASNLASAQSSYFFAYIICSYSIISMMWNIPSLFKLKTLLVACF
ncbi:hypothetical protein C8R43DRAFT_474729 [Mycena crocata]|nr:hypothetical protein C8R43DRAFT_474729 [Mycena crocata]